MTPRILLSRDTNPYRNLAREEALLLSERLTDPVLFLWQNARTVVIGKGQNAWRECRTALLSAENIRLARRTTGGGAVFHDLGNLNFSFLLPRAQYDLPRQLSVVRAAVRTFGIDCAFSGRNDLEASGRKFSGNAFRFLPESALHHGTLLVSTDIEKLTRYLAVSKEKLTARGVASVPSRVVNLSELSEEVTVERLIARLTDAFCAEYGQAEAADIESVPLVGVEALEKRNATWDWNYGETPAFDITLERKFPFGMVELCLSLREGIIASCRVFTDAMDPDLSGQIEKALTGCPFEPRRMGERAGGEIGEWLKTVSP